MKYFDCHCDTLTRLANEGGNLKKNQINLDLERIENQFLGYGQIFALWTDVKAVKGSLEDDFMRMYRKALLLLEEQKDEMVLCKNAEDLENVWREGKKAAFLSVEDASYMGRLIENAKELGIRFVLPVWNYENEYGYGAAADNKKGLKPAGMELIQKLEEQEIVIDVSHLSEGGFYDVCERTKRPFMASHSNTRAYCDNVRNLTDDQIRALIQREGFMGLNLYREFLGSDSCTLEQILFHTEHVLELGGEKILGFGSDFDGCGDTFPHGITGTESMEKIVELFLLHNYSEDLVKDIFYRNAEQFLKRAL